MWANCGPYRGCVMPMPVWTVVELGLLWTLFGVVVGVVFGHMVVPRD